MDAKLFGTLLAMRELQSRGLSITIYQVRSAFRHLGFPLKVDESQLAQIEKLYREHTALEVRGMFSKQTCLEKYGETSASKTQAAKKHAHDLFFGKSDEEKAAIKKKRAETNIKLFGVENFNSAPERIAYLKSHWKSNPEKRKQTCLERYGAEHYTQSDQGKAHMRQVREQMPQEVLEARCKKAVASRLARSPEEKAATVAKYHSTWQSRRDSEQQKLEAKLGFSLVSITDLQLYLERDLATLHRFIEDNCLQTYVSSTRHYLKKSDADWVISQYKSRESHGFSQSEKAIVEYMRAFYGGPILENDRKVLGGKGELDIYLPEKGLAIEFNGCYWHSDAVWVSACAVPPDETRLRAKHRHFEKYKQCLQKGIRLLQIFEDDFEDRRDIALSVIRNALGAASRRIFARKCVVRDVPIEVYRAFLEANHLQGYSYADVRKGLYFGDELVELVGVNTKGTHRDEPEMVRLCSKMDTSVVGGFSKLLKASDCSSLVSYVDPFVFSGSGYAKVGFKVDGVNAPTYFYVRRGYHKRIPRYMFMRDRIKALYERGELRYYNPEETEAVNMYKNDYYRIWNCGTIRVVWKKPDAAARAEVFALMDKNTLS